MATAVKALAKAAEEHKVLKSELLAKVEELGVASSVWI